MGTNSKMKDETYHEKTHKCEQIKIFKILPGITKGKEILLFFCFSSEPKSEFEPLLSLQPESGSKSVKTY